MLITCPECQFARNINADLIPPKSQLATCPRCQSKFRFRVLPDDEISIEKCSLEEQYSVPVVEHVPPQVVSKNVVGDDAQLSTSSRVEKPQPQDHATLPLFAEASADADSELFVVNSKADELVAQYEEEFVAQEFSPQQVTAESLEDETNVAPDIEFHGNDDDCTAVYDDEVAEGDVQSIPTRRSASAQALRDRHVSFHAQALESEEEALQRYAQEQGTEGFEAASVHIVTDSDDGSLDIWDAIAAMGEEPECTESFIPGCTSAQVHVIPWEDGRLGLFGRAFGTVAGLLTHPVTFWRGINAKAGLLLPLLFFVFTCFIAAVSIAGWAQVASIYWEQLIEMMQPLLAQNGLTIPALVLPVIATPFLLATILVLLIAPFIIGGLTHLASKAFGGRSVPFSTGFKGVTYSSGAFVWLLIPVLGVCLSAMYLSILYVQSIRAGYNLSLRKSVVIVFMVSLMVVAIGATACVTGISLM